MNQADKNLVMMMINEAKIELRNQFNGLSNTHSSTEEATNVNVSDNTDAILELAEIIGGGE